MNVGDIIYGVSLDLNDQEVGGRYVRWTQEQLMFYLQEAVIELSASYRQLFEKRVVVRVTAGNLWQQACDCTHITRIVGETTADGTLLRTLREVTDNKAFEWPGDIAEHCQQAGHLTDLHSYSISATKDNEFRVFPPVAPPQAKYVLVECYGQPASADLKNMDFDIPDRLVQAVKQWMLYRALIVDSENNPAIVDVAKTHLQTYLALTKELSDESMKQEAARYAANVSDVRAVQGGGSR